MTQLLQNIENFITCQLSAQILDEHQHLSSEVRLVSAFVEEHVYYLGRLYGASRAQRSSSFSLSSRSSLRTGTSRRTSRILLQLMGSCTVCSFNFFPEKKRWMCVLKQVVRNWHLLSVICSAVCSELHHYRFYGV
ncbi:Hypothetical_protein [Hexamita inflata]|uniref:Hypothetical_protein n=1 Tax=Hexamita inflata TaxID=28002 RepID=A0AA86PLC9_9EUKA|nr:Hypothetical protein HINF_LOCUS29569 [Hexamita inflata]